MALTQKEQRALKEYALAHPDSTVLMDDAPANATQKKRLDASGVSPAKWNEIEKEAGSQEKYVGQAAADWQSGAFEAAASELANVRTVDIGTHTKTRASAALEADAGNALQDFVNLPNNPKAVGGFRLKYRDFFPDAFWFAVLHGRKRPFDGSVIVGVTTTESAADAVSAEQARQCLSGPLWIEVQTLLREAWRTSFADEIIAPLLRVLIGDDGDYLSQSLAQLAGTEGKSPLAIFQPTRKFQLAVLAMHRSPWRARFCGKCGAAFIADEKNKNRKYCGLACSGETRNRGKLAYEESGKRPPRKKAKKKSASSRRK